MTNVQDIANAAPSQHARARALADLQQMQSRHSLPAPTTMIMSTRGDWLFLELESSAEIDAWTKILGLPAARSVERATRQPGIRRWRYATDGRWPGNIRAVDLVFTREFPVLEEQGPRPGDAA